MLWADWLWVVLLLTTGNGLASIQGLAACMRAFWEALIMRLVKAEAAFILAVWVLNVFCWSHCWLHLGSGNFALCFSNTTVMTQICHIKLLGLFEGRLCTQVGPLLLCYNAHAPSPVPMFVSKATCFAVLVAGGECAVVRLVCICIMTQSPRQALESVTAVAGCVALPERFSAQAPKHGLARLC
jgi:hypothetical protein